MESDVNITIVKCDRNHIFNITLETTKGRKCTVEVHAVIFTNEKFIRQVGYFGRKYIEPTSRSGRAWGSKLFATYAAEISKRIMDTEKSEPS